jgi:hypothetical protein
MIRDCLGREIKAGDYVLYAKNHGGNPIMAYAWVVGYGERKNDDTSSEVIKVYTPSPVPGDPFEETWRSERCLQWSKSGQLFVVSDPPPELLAKFRRTPDEKRVNTIEEFVNFVAHGDTAEAAFCFADDPEETAYPLVRLPVNRPDELRTGPMWQPLPKFDPEERVKLEFLAVLVAFKERRLGKDGHVLAKTHKG